MPIIGKPCILTKISPDGRDTRCFTDLVQKMCRFVQLCVSQKRSQELEEVDQ